ncbi:Multidrug resistance protein 3 [Actinomadura rubteroloni]|uniref:Multidrug resistance protein 3 n=1 Tax=Actinomadura rubteroloni TaxID=1926885 RepID=A0A2P4UKB0_9ACTN|nr:MFS transporter [Actinomadura rubteroloni]POM25470.1 Multidrug resistance protein 3 [Actinomadura rubteroloni]
MTQANTERPTKPGTVPDAAPEYSHRRILEILSGLMMAMLTAMISTSVVGTALPTIVGDLGGQDQLALVASASLLTMTASTPLWGKLSDIFGRKLTFQTALVIFVIASVCAGLAQNMGELIAARAVQGLGVGGLTALAQVILGDVVPPRQRGRYAGYMGAVFGVSTVAGPLLGGFIVDADGLGWRWCFYVCVPLAVVAFLVIQRVLKLPKVRRDTRVDVLGAFTITGSAALLVLVLSLGGDQFPWRSAWTYGLLGAAVVLAILAIVAERIARDPILPPRLFRNRTFVLASVASLAVGCAMFGAMIYLPQYFQIVKGMSPTKSGLMTLPMVLAMFVTSTFSGQIVTRLGRWKAFPVAGLVLVATSMVLLSRLHVGTSTVVIGADVAVLGAGLGLTLQILILAAQNAAGLKDLAATTSGVSFFRNLGGSMGVAAFGAILNNRLRDELADGLRSLHIAPPPGGTSLGSPAAIRHLPEPFHGLVVHSFTDALETVFLVGVPIALVGFLAVLGLKELPLRGAARASEPAPAPHVALPPDGASIGGTVRDADGTPIPDVALTLIDAGGRQLGRAVTGTDGAYALPTPGPATYVLIAATSGHEPQAATLAVGDRPVVFDLLLAGGGGLAGIVRGRAGTPVPAATVVVTDVRGEVVGTARTGPDGAYTVTDLATGAYTLAVSADGHRPAALPVEVRGRTRRDVDLPDGAHLGGTVRGPSGSPLGDASVTLLDGAGNVVARTLTGPDGAYAFTDLAGGPYTVIAAGYPPAATALTLDGAGTDAHDVRLAHPEA